MSDQKYSIEEIRDIMSAVGVTQKNDPASTSLAGTPALHGPLQGSTTQYGAFSYPGVRPEMFSALTRPRSFARLFNPVRSEFTDEILEINTGQTAGSGTNATGFCGNPPVVGQLKMCQQIFQFGDYYIKTNLNALPLVGQLRNRADVPRNILNAAPSENPLIPDLMYRLTDTRDQLAYELFLVGVDLERTLETVLVTGDITQSSVSTDLGWIKEFNGLDGQIKTGYTDAVTGIACPAMDSAVITFNADVGATIAGGDGRNLVTTFSDLYYGLLDRAAGVGMANPDIRIIMRKEAFRGIVEIYACQYNTHRCNSLGTAGNPFVVDTRDANTIRMEMLNGQYLLIDGVQVPVMFSEGIPQGTPAAATWQSDVYMGAVSWQGVPLLRLEYFGMDNPYSQKFASSFNAANIDYLNNGMFIVGVRDTGLCREFHFASRMRLIVETPWLWGRIDNINYSTNSAPMRNALPGTSLYANGGYTYRS